MTAATEAAGGWLRGRQEVQRLDNGLEVVVLENDSSPVVTTAMTYRFGARDDPAERAGLAHFLEHMMFKGSAGFAAGEVDRRTRRLGGSNNAFTSHDATTYYFSFGRDRWTEALDIEADRMRGLLLVPEEVEAERAVILEEIAMYQAEPWDGLERAVQERLHRAHPYGRPVLGDAETAAVIVMMTAATFLGRIASPSTLTPRRSSRLASASSVKGELRIPSPVPSRPMTNP